MSELPVGASALAAPLEVPCMKNPRRIALTDEVIAEHNLSTDPPPPDSLFWKMWSSCTGIAQEALQTPFIQGIKSGTLDPIRYGGFNVNDAYYCFHGAQDYLASARRAADPTLQMFLNKKHSSYQKYNATFPGIWRIRDCAGIVPFEVCQQYSDFEITVASQEDPIYCLIVMLPCEYLWYWLAVQLGSPKPENLYASWVTGNDSPKGPYAMGNFLDAYQREHPGGVDEQKAIQIYTQAMTFEQQNFAAAMS
jgi:thiaminase (transcriptional activator TenA)